MYLYTDMHYGPYDLKVWQLHKGVDHLICGGGGGAKVFLHGQTFFDSKYKRTIFFRPFQKVNSFFSAVKHKTIFFTIYFI